MKLDPTAVAVAVTLSAAALITALPVPSSPQDLGSGSAIPKYDQALEERTSVPPLLNVFDDAPRAVAQTLLSSPSKVGTTSAAMPEAAELVSTRLSLVPAQDFRTGTTSSSATSSDHPSVELLTHPSETSLVVQPTRPVAHHAQTPTWLSPSPQSHFTPESGLVKPQVGSTKSAFRRVKPAVDSSPFKTELSLRVWVSREMKAANKRTNDGKYRSRTYKYKKEMLAALEKLKGDPNVPVEVGQAAKTELERLIQNQKDAHVRYVNGPKGGAYVARSRVNAKKWRDKQKQSEHAPQR